MPPFQLGVAVQLFAYSFLLAASYQIGRVSADSSFLARLGVTALPAIFLLSGLVVSVSVVVANKLARAYSHRSVSTAVAGVLGMSTIVMALLLPLYHHSPWFIGAIYLLAEVRGTLGAISINWATHDRLPKDSRHSFAAIGISVPVAGILLGTIMGVESQIETTHWLLLAGILDLLAVLPLWIRPTSDRKSEQDSPSRLSISHLLMSARTANRQEGAGLVTALMGLTFFKFLVLAVVSFEWKRNAEVYYGNHEHQLTAYFAIFYAVAHAISLLLQTLLAARLLARKSLRTALLVMPLGLLICASWLLLTQSPLLAIVLMTVAKGMDGWRRSVEDTGMIMLVSRVPKQQRTSLISLNAGIIKPFGEILAAINIWLLSNWMDSWVIWFWALAAILWASWTMVAVREYRVHRKNT